MKTVTYYPIMLKQLVIVFLLLSTSISLCLAQNSKASSWISSAEREMEKQNFKQAAELYEKALKFDKQNPDYKYQLAMAHYRQEKYDKVINMMEEVMEKSENQAKVNWYRLLGNSYDLSGNYDACINWLRLGQKKFPKAGEFYLDLGIVEMIKENYEEALTHWETGIEAVPEYPDNYYWAAKIFAESNEKLWALIYGELFMNMERGTERFDDMSEILYGLYLQVIEEKMDEKVTIQLERDEKNPFEEAHVRIFGILKKYDMLNLDRGRTIDGGNNTLKAIAMVRRNFMETWLQGFSLTYGNILYKFHQQMFDLTFLDSYNFWLFSKANSPEFISWMNKNQFKYQQFIDWFVSNPLQVDIENKMHRMQYLPSREKKRMKEMMEKLQNQK